MSAYWPWWAGAIGLAVVTVGYYRATGRYLGISGMWDRVLHWREEQALERLDAQFADDRELEEALAAATAEEFGTVAASPGLPERADEGAPAPAAVRGPVPLVMQTALLVSVFVGGLSRRSSRAGSSCGPTWARPSRASSPTTRSR